MTKNYIFWSLIIVFFTIDFIYTFFPTLFGLNFALFIQRLPIYLKAIYYIATFALILLTFPYYMFRKKKS